MYNIISFINSYFKGHFCTSMKLFAHANSLFETDTRARENLFLPDFFLFRFAVFNKTPLPYKTCYTLVIYMLIKRSYFLVSQSFLLVQLNILEFIRPTTHDLFFASFFHSSHKFCMWKKLSYFLTNIAPK